MLPNSNTDAFTTRLGLQQAPRKRNSPAAPAKRDGPIWASVTVLQDHATSPSVQCNHCDKKFCGGATRIREHITGGGVIEACTSRASCRQLATSRRWRSGTRTRTADESDDEDLAL